MFWIIVSAYVGLWLLQLLFWPIAKSVFKELSDEGWVLSRFMGLMGMSLIIWEVSYLGIPINTQLGVALTAVFFLGIDVYLVKKHGIAWLKPNKDNWKLIFMEEYLFAVGFVGICLVRSFLPNIDSLEKFMDYGFIVRYANSSSLPPTDMWQAGNYINYYSFGHFWASVLIRFLGVPTQIGYNLVLGFVAGQALCLSFFACTLLSGNKKGALFGALLGSLVVVFGGNSHTLWYLLKNHSLNGYWYADATRFIHNTIHEFPGYSLVVSDLHGHLLDLPTVLVFVIIFCLYTQKSRWWKLVLMGVLMAVMMMTNTWDVPIYGLLVCVFLVGKLLKNPSELVNVIKEMVVAFGVAMTTSLPWWLKFTSISSGVALVQQRSPLWQLFALWGVAIVINTIAWIVSRKAENRLIIRSLIITSVLLVIIPEIIYARDIYPDHPRANTMFKLTYQACILIGLTFGVLAGKMTELLKEKITFGKSFVFTVCLSIFASLLIFPTVSFPAFFDNFKSIKGLDGEVWIKTKQPEKYEAIQYLKQNKDSKNLVEAVGDSYTEFNAISVFTGIPTIQGWRVHEWLWRGGYDSVSVREQEVKEVYEGKEADKAREILQKYNVGWVVVGVDEGSMYLINHPKIRSLGKVVWEMNESYLVRVE